MLVDGSRERRICLLRRKNDKLTYKRQHTSVSASYCRTEVLRSKALAVVSFTRESTVMPACTALDEAEDDAVFGFFCARNGTSDVTHKRTNRTDLQTAMKSMSPCLRIPPRRHLLPPVCSRPSESSSAPDTMSAITISAMPLESQDSWIRLRFRSLALTCCSLCEDLI